MRGVGWGTYNGWTRVTERDVLSRVRHLRLPEAIVTNALLAGLEVTLWDAGKARYWYEVVDEVLARAVA